MRIVIVLLCLLAVLFGTSVSAQNISQFDGLKRKLLYYYDARPYLYESMSVGLNSAALVSGGSAELTAEFRASRYVNICLNTGFTVSKTPLFQSDNYKTKGTFLKFGVKNYLLNSFFPSKLDVFNGLYYIGSDISQDYRAPGSAEVQNYNDYNNFAALQSGISYRPLRNITINAGVQYTFLKDRKNYPAAAEMPYQPGVGRWKNNSATEAILTIQYRLPVNLCCTTICCIDENGEFRRCAGGWWHKCARWL